jgi:hypothetical protein
VCRAYQLSASPWNEGTGCEISNATLLMLIASPS